MQQDCHLLFFSKGPKAVPVGIVVDICNDIFNNEKQWGSDRVGLMKKVGVLLTQNILWELVVVTTQCQSNGNYILSCTKKDTQHIFVAIRPS